MKKLFFSAVALIAFSSFSMANTIAVDEVKVEKEQIVDMPPTASDCASTRIHYYNHLSSQGIPHDEASARSYRIYFQCMSLVLTYND